MITRAHRRPSQVRPPAATPGRSASSYRFDRLRLRHFRLLELVCSKGSLGSAARELGVSQPAATLLLRELEAVFGAALVDRDHRGARLTAAGRYALERLSIALASVERAAEAARHAELEPILRVGAVQIAGVRALPAALAALERSGTPGRLQLQEGRARDLLALLCAGELDCVIGWMDESLADALPVAQLVIQPLWYGRMQVVASARHPLARERAVDVHELSRWRWIVPQPASRTHAAFQRLFLHNGVPVPPVSVECSALHTTVRLVAATRCLAVAPDTVIAHYAKQGAITALKGASLDLGRNQVSLMTRRDSAGLPAVERFREALLRTAS